MVWLIEQLRIWISRAKAEVSDLSIEETRELPPAIAQQLDSALEALPPHPLYLQCMRQALSQALEQWRNQPELNSLTILHSPVDSFLCIFEEGFASDGFQDWEYPTHRLSWSSRPFDLQQFTTELKKALQPLNLLPSVKNEDSEANGGSEREDCAAPKPAGIVMIPHLEWGFLRCIEGWQAIELLRDTAIANPNYFWLIGCNHWAWQFLNHVTQLEAYFDQTLSLPELEGEALRDWLFPILQSLDETVKLSSQVSSQEEDEQSELRQVYDHLSDVSRGIGSVAKALWRYSLKYEPDEKKDEVDPEPDPPAQLDPPSKSVADWLAVGSLREKTARYLALPSLSADDRYLLFSLLLHGGLSVSHLSLTLGETEGKVRAQVQTLVRQQVLVRQGEVYRVHPVHYPRLRAELNRNNFLVGRDH